MEAERQNGDDELGTFKNAWLWYYQILNTTAAGPVMVQLTLPESGGGGLVNLNPPVAMDIAGYETLARQLGWSRQTKMGGDSLMGMDKVPHSDSEPKEYHDLITGLTQLFMNAFDLKLHVRQPQSAGELQYSGAYTTRNNNSGSGNWSYGVQMQTQRQVIEVFKE